MNHCRSQDLKSLMGDFNVKVKESKEGQAVGPFGLGQRNKMDEKLIKWYKANRLVVSNT